MDHINTGTLWFVIIALGIGSFGLRFVFTGLVGDREMPAWLLRHLRYTAVAILPALVAPQVIWRPSVLVSISLSRASFSTRASINSWLPKGWVYLK